MISKRPGRTIICEVSRISRTNSTTRPLPILLKASVCSRENAGALNNRGQTRYLMEDYKAAVQDYTAAIAIDAKNPLVLNNRALAYMELNDLNNAMNDLQAALKLVPQYPEALNNRGVVYQQRQEFDEAIADFTEALKLDSEVCGCAGKPGVFVCSEERPCQRRLLTLSPQ